MYFKLAWRNLWRNRRRTLITLGSIFFAVILSTLMMSLKEGIYVNMIDAMVGDFTGYAQVHQQGYWEDKTLDNSLALSDSLEQALQKIKGLNGYVPRLESFALAASEEITKGAMVVGVDPEKEKLHTALQDRVTAGGYLAAEDKAVLVGTGLAEYLQIGVEDTLVLLGQGYHGTTAAGKYPVKGLVKFGSPELSKQLVFLPIQEGQWLYGAEDRYTALVLLPEDPLKTERVVASLRPHLPGNYEVMNWQELNPDLINMIETDRVEGYVFMFILYTVISFGIFGTLLMMLSERKREFGILVAVGMKRLQLASVVFLELLVISILGAILGMVAAFPLCAYWHYNPYRYGTEISKMMEEYGFEAVMQTSIEPYVFIQQALVILFIACLIAIYPFLKITRLDAISSMRS